MSTTSGTSAIESCRHCGCIHFGKTCDRVSAMEYYPDGTLKRVEYHEPKMIDPYPPPYYPWWQVPPWTCGGTQTGQSGVSTSGYVTIDPNDTYASSFTSRELPFDPLKWGCVTMPCRDEGIMVN